MADAYERDQMPGVGEVLHRQKVTSPRWAIGVAVAGPVVPALGLGVVAAVTGAWLPALGFGALGLGLGALMSFLMVTFASGRIAVSEGELHVQIGMAGPKIPIADIAGVSLAPSGSNRMGMGVRNDLRGTTLYTMWGDNARAVHVTTTDGKKRIFVCKEPEAMHAALEEALGRKGRAVPKVRVADTGADAALDEDEAAAEAKRQRRTR